MPRLDVSDLREALALLQLSDESLPEILATLPIGGSGSSASREPQLRRVEIQSFFQGLVRERLTRLRGLEQFSSRLSEELEAAQSDFAEGSLQREAWSAVYFRYFCPHRPTIDQVVAAAGVSPRTFHRRLNVGLSALAERLATESPDRTEARASATERSLPDALAPLHAHLVEGAAEPTPALLEAALRETATELDEHLLLRWARLAQELSSLPLPFLELPVSGPIGSGRWWSSLESVWQETGDHLLLLGPPGAGKTTTLLHLEKLIIEESLASGSHRVTLPLRLGLDWTSEGSTASPREAVEHRWARHCPHLPRLDELEAAGRLVVLADGLNEIPALDRSLRHQTIDAWARFFADLVRHGCRVLVSCRELELDRPPRASGLELLRVHLEPPEPDAVRAAVTERLPGPEADEWLDSVELLRHPLLLRLLVSETDQGAAGSGMEALLTRYVRQGLREDANTQADPGLDPHDLLRLHLGRWAQPWELPESTLLTSLGQLAMVMQGGDPGGRRWSMPHVRACLALAPDDEAEGRDLLQRAVAMGLLRIDLEAREVGFGHPLFQDYFVARELVRHPRPELVFRAWRREELESRLVDVLSETPVGEALPPLEVTGWEEATSMAVVMADDSEPRVRELAALRPALAGRTVARLRQAGLVSEETTREIAGLLAKRSRDLEADLRERLEAGRALGLLGDPRLESHEHEHGRYLLREMVEIPDTELVLGESEGRPGEPEQVSVPGFRLAVLPVTIEEWECFFEAGGHDDPRFWPEGPARRWQAGIDTLAAARHDFFHGNRRYRDDPRKLDEDFLTGLIGPETYARIKRRTLLSDDELRAELLEHHPDVPRRKTGESWGEKGLAGPALTFSYYEARAYCRWLNERTGRRFRLPTEPELWAAYHRPRARQPIEGEPIGNILSTRLRGVVPVGLFPMSDTVDGVMDLAGNIRCWTSTAWHEETDGPETGRELTEVEPLTLVTIWGSAPAWDTPARCLPRRAGTTYPVGLRLAEDV